MVARPTAGAAGTLPRSLKPRPRAVPSLLATSPRVLPPATGGAGGAGGGAAAEAIARPAHHTDAGFVNPWPSYKEFGWRDFLTGVLPNTRALDTYALPVVTPDWRAVAAPREACQAVWMGHASFLVQAGGWNMLTDPVFSVRASPVQFMGPARYTPPPCAVDELPPLHAVLFSHNHYDHIDSGTVAALLDKEARELEARGRSAVAGSGDAVDGYPQQPYGGTTYICPLRVGRLLVSLGIPQDRIVELDWWQSTHVGREPRGVVPLPPAASPATPAPTHASLPTITAVPAQHQSARTPFDRNATLWCGYAVHVPQALVPGAPPVSWYFSGDTGYRTAPPGVEPLSAAEAALPRCPAFAEVGARHGPFDLAFLPLGAYSPRWFMSSFHASPEDAVQMHLDLRARRSVGMHWGAFPLTDEPIEEPPARLAVARAAAGLPDDAFVAVHAGALIGATAGVQPPTALARAC